MGSLSRVRGFAVGVVATVVASTFLIGVVPAVAADTAVTAERPAIVSPKPVHDRVVSAVPVSWTPQILNGRTLDIAQVGDSVVVGGIFTQVAPSGGTPVLNRTNVFAFSATNGAINTNFAPSVSNGDVRAVEPGPTAGTVYLAGSFQGVNGTTRKVVLVNVATGQLVPGFTAPAMNGAVNDIQLVGNRLYVGGVFTTVGGQPYNGLVSLNATTGARESFLSVALTENQNYTGQSGQAQGPVGAKAISVTPQGDQLAVIGNFRKADGLERRQMVVIDLTGPVAAVRADWKTNRYAPACFSNAFDSYIRGVTSAPDGSYFAVTTTGGHNSGTLCDSVARWDITDTGDDVQPEWSDLTGGDTLLGVASSGHAIYVGGHQRWLNNPNASDYPGSGAVPRPGLGAVDVQSGMPISWNPGRNPRGVGAEAIYISDAGLWVGSDTEQIGNWRYKRPRIAFFPVSTGAPLGAGSTGDVPSNAYISTSPQTSEPVGSALYRVNAGGGALAALDGGPNWMADDGSTNTYRNSGSNSAGYSLVPTLDQTVPATAPAELYSTERWDPNGGEEMTWSFPVPAGQKVVVRLYLANRCDCTNDPGERSFDVSIDGTTALDNYDISADVGHNVGTVKTFTVTSDGAVDLQWRHEVENPLVNGIEILNAVTTPPPPVPTSSFSRVWFTGAAATETPTPAPAGDIDWSTVRGAVVIDGELFYGAADGSFTRRTFDGTSYGAASAVDPYNDPYWSDVSTGSGGLTYRGTKPSFYNQISSLSGLAYSDGRLYYTRSGSSKVFSRGFSPSSGALSEATVEVPAFTSSAVGGIFFDDASDSLYFVTAATGVLSRVGWTGSATTGTPVPVSGPGIDGVNWSGRAVFLAGGPEPVPNVTPTAVITSDCDRLQCTFSSAGSSDPDGEIASVAWDFGDGSPATASATASHTFVEGTYTVTLTVTDERGGVGSATAELAVVANQPPTAVIGTPDCEPLVCTFDGSGSADPDDTIVSYTWDFGDGTPSASGVTAAHDFVTPGAHMVTLTVVDEFGASVSATLEVDVPDGSEPVLTAATPVGAAAVSLSVMRPTVTIPSSVAAGDLLLLYATVNQTLTIPAPAGWTPVRNVASGTLSVGVFSRVADGSEPGASVGVNLPAAYRSDLTLTAYRGVGPEGIEVSAGAAGSATSAHTSPVVSVAGEQRVVLTFWADRSSTTTGWTAPTGVDLLSTQVGTGSGRVSTLLVASGAGAGDAGGLTATTNAASARDASVTLVLAPTLVGPPANTPPAAVMDVSCVRLVCNFDGTGSSDSDGSVDAYLWDFGDGSAIAAGATASHTYSGDGTFVARLAVKDDRGAVATVESTMTLAANLAPVPLIGEVVCDRLQCEFDGSGSSDPDDAVAAYSWDFGDGSGGSSDAAPTHGFAHAGTFTVTLTVTDAHGASAAADITVTAQENQPPSGLIGDPVCDELACTFDGSGSTDPDSGDSVVAYGWDFGDGTTADGATAQHTFPAAGSYTVTLTVTDAGGAVGSATHDLVVNTAPVPITPTLVGKAAASLWVSTPTVAVPAEVQAGDLLILFASTNQATDYAGPTEWTSEGRVVSASLATSVFSRVATAADAGTQVSVALPSAFRSDLTLVAYRGVGEDGVESFASSVSANTAAHVSPTITVPGGNRVVLSYWADRSSSTTAWAAPAGVDVVSMQVGAGSGRVSSLLVVSQPGAGAFGGLTANTDAASSRGAAVTLSLAPGVTP